MKKNKKSIKVIKIPKCPKCKQRMEMGFTTEQEEKNKKKPKIIICFGICDKCKQILVCDLIKTEELPSNFKELKEIIKKK